MITKQELGVIHGSNDEYGDTTYDCTTAFIYLFI